MEDKIIKLDVDSKEVCLKTLKDISTQLGFMFELIQEDKLSEKMRDTLSNLFEYRMVDISKKTGYDSLSAKVLDEKHKAIREANTKIHELERKLGSEDLTDKIKEQIKYLTGLVDKWWDIEGFNYIRNIFFRKYGSVEVDLSFSFTDFSTRYSDKPVTDKEKHKSWIEEVKERGFKIEKCKGYGFVLIDCESNRQMLIDMIKNRFPSADILQFKNYNIARRSGDDVFQIEKLKILITDIRDIKNLENYISKFHEIEED
ncbi:hypothetical protein [Clostridium botulinum]|uniref:hypothetical protein n=1 Tax=Clostridium botulinum TaxID=1491 RepID=UPI001E3B3B0E|nr:hypothetical protein [Clostridium botulinum]MCD3202853.1 hypothetical protein [Clostridium botulinum C/D]MCD3230860.1 hypothetical protein [Clostridium botulinum C/D]MCD3253955.1 hypothetical protein [Clostridium botulinum C/D]MCD3279449.1 hypothetical protein [Clostridium botulinum C/D]MCD3282780.1 hypothetical protein [Clostridium botulinum C/D]